MPLLDHFNPPLSRTHPWRSFHGAWAAAIARLLNQSVLPSGYYAVPLASPENSDAVEIPLTNGMEVQVLTEEDCPRLAAVTVLVNARNKNHPQTLQEFAAKCVGYLQQGSSLVIVDTVTTRRADLNGAILALFEIETSIAATVSSLAAVSYRAVALEGSTQQLQLWPEPLALGQPLPTLPLWIVTDFSVPLDLDASYQTTCRDLRIRQRE